MRRRHPNCAQCRDDVRSSRETMRLSRSGKVKRACILIIIFLLLRVVFHVFEQKLGYIMTDFKRGLNETKTDPPTCTGYVDALNGRYCRKRFGWLKANWMKFECFRKYRLSPHFNVTDCDILLYLIATERVCIEPPNMDKLIHLPTVSSLQPAVPVESLDGLLASLEQCGHVCAFIKSRVTSMRIRWVESGANFITRHTCPSPDVSNRKCSGNVPPNDRSVSALLHMGLLRRQYGLNFGESALRGGPLGELVQWADLAAGLTVLGHRVTLSWSPDRLREMVEPQTVYEDCAPARRFDLVFTDLYGLEQIREVLGTLHHYRCVLRVLDVYGTDPKYNHPLFNPHKHDPSAWGGKGLDPRQFFTQFPHSPDNSFLGFVVEKRNDDPSNRRRNSALLYGKNPKALHGSKKDKYLRLIQKYFEDVHATMWKKNDNMKDNDDVIPSYVTNHENMEQAAFLDLLATSSLYVGLESPVEGPAPLEAIASGVVFLNPCFRPPRAADPDKPNERALSSQNPFAEQAIGEPHVYTIDIRDLAQVELALQQIKKTPPVEPFVPPEFTYHGFLERLQTYVSRQDFCPGHVRTSVINPDVYWSVGDDPMEGWPDRGTLQVKTSRQAESCTEACRRQHLTCEHAHFQHVNATDAFRQVACKNLTVINPRRDQIDHRRRKGADKQFVVPCYLPSYNVDTGACLLQSDPLLYSCACAPPSGIVRLCPCRS